jgi:HAD superfamily hydrolase (TIGR01548 family)
VDSVIVFDMDGVLAEVTESYRESIVQTVKFFTGKTVTGDAIQGYKNQGGWNNDWALSQKIAADFGTQIDYDTVIEKFNEYFLGEDGNGLVQHESWFPQPGLLDRLGLRYGLSLFTGRLRYEADITLRRFAPCVKFDPMICADDVTAAKPAPEGLLTIQQRRPGQKLWYVGDTVDDARCARAAAVPFIGIAARAHTKRDELISLFQQEDAIAILENVNQIEEAL